MNDLFNPKSWHHASHGPRYKQLAHHISQMIKDGELMDGCPLPAERDLAEQAGVSRVTVRKAVEQLVRDKIVVQRQGSGSYVKRPAYKLKQSLNLLVSFTENLRARGYSSESKILSCGLVQPTSEVMMTLGVSASHKVAQIRRLRRANDVPIAIEASYLPEDILPDPSLVTKSLYAVLRAQDKAPVRAIQRVSAVNLNSREARELRLPEDAAALEINRTAFLESGRPIEYTKGLYRSDIYDFVVELDPNGKMGAANR